MKRRWMALAVLALLAAGVVMAQTTAQNGQATRGVQQGALIGGLGYTDSSMQVPGVNPTTHALYSEEQSKDRDYVQYWPPAQVISTASLAAAAGDSTTSPIDVHAYRHLKLLIKCTPIGASVNTTVRLAFQFREHVAQLTDSNSTFAEYLYSRMDHGTTTASVVDTTMAGHLVTGSVSLPWSGEYVVTINMNRSAPANGAAANIFSYPNGVSIPLDSFYGRPARFEYLSIRVRNLNITGPAVKLQVALKGFAQ